MKTVANISVLIIKFINRH